jgi:hypothetical protein
MNDTAPIFGAIHFPGKSIAATLKPAHAYNIMKSGSVHVGS